MKIIAPKLQWHQMGIRPENDKLLRNRALVTYNSFKIQ